MVKNIILILSSSLILYFSTEEFGFMFLSIPTFIALSYNLSDLTLKILNKNHDSIKRVKNFEFIPLMGILTLLFVLKDYENTIGGYNLFWKLSFFSLIFSLLFSIILSRYFNFKNERRFYNLLSISICFFILIPNIGIFINKNIHNQAERKQVIKINFKKINKGSRYSDSYEIFIKTRFDNNERLDISKEFYENISENQSIILTLKRGILNYDYVSKIEKNKFN